MARGRSAIVPRRISSATDIARRTPAYMNDKSINREKKREGRWVGERGAPVQSRRAIARSVSERKKKKQRNRKDNVPVFSRRRAIAPRDRPRRSNHRGGGGGGTRAETGERRGSRPTMRRHDAPAHAFGCNGDRCAWSCARKSRPRN